MSEVIALSPPSKEGGLNYLEQLTARSIVTCPNQKAPILIGSSADKKKAVFVRPGCHLWNCPVCGPKNGLRWIARMLHATNAIGGKWSFVTITAHRSWRGPRSLKNIRKNWPKLRKRVVRAVDYELHYLWIYERHKDMSWHVHMLTNANLPTAWWKDNCAECGLGYQAKSVELENYGYGAGYVAKYLLKQCDLEPGYPKNMRRITTSRNFPELPELEIKEDDLSWRPAHDRDQVESLGRFYKSIGWEVQGLRTTLRQVDKITSDEYHF